MKEKRVGLLTLLGLATLFVVNLFISFRFGADSLASHYVDEEETIVIAGHLGAGKLIYRDYFSHHQPLPYIVSNLIQKISPRNDVLGLTVIHRAFVSFWSVAWWGVLIFFFGPVFFIPAFIFELMKIFFLGHFFLAESLVVFPLLWLSCEVLLKRSISPYFSGFCLSLVVFLFAPLWPLALLYLVILARRTSLLKTIIGALPVFALVLHHTPISDYLYQTIFINLRYYIPDALSTSKYRFVNVFLGPLLALANPIINTSLFVIKILSLGFLFGLVLLFVRGEYKKFFLAWLVLGMAGFHGSPALSMYYQDFHLLPWFALLILLTTLLLTGKRSAWAVAAAALIAVLVLTWGRLSVLPEYSKYPGHLALVSLFLSANGDQETTLFVASPDTFLYRLSGLSPANEFVYYHPWYENPYVSKKIAKSFSTKPPTFLYYPPARSAVRQYLANYTSVCLENKPLYLYVRKEARSGWAFPVGYSLCR